MAEPTVRTLPTRHVDRLDGALARLSGRLAPVLAQLGDRAAAGFLDGLPGAAAPTPPDGRCLDLPTGPLQPVDRLVAGTGLTAAESELLVLALLGHSHEGVAAVLRGLHPRGLPCATVGLAGSLAETGALSGLRCRAEVRSALARLLATGVVVLDADGPYPERSLRPAPLVHEALTGLPGWPSGVTAEHRPVVPDLVQGWLRDPAVTGARDAVERSAPVTLLLCAPRPGQLAERLAALVLAAGRTPDLLAVDPCDGPTVSDVLLLALTRGTVPVIWSEQATRDLRLRLPRLPVPLLLALPGRGVRTWPRPVLELQAGPHPRADRLAALTAAFPDLGPAPGPLGPATVEPGDVLAAAGDVRLRAALLLGPVGWDDVGDRIDAGSTDAVPVGAVLVHPRAGWSDLVLPADRLQQLHEAVDRLQQQERVLGDWGFLRGRAGRRGLRMLFAGPPGTGKTLAAEVVAGALGRDLLVVDLSQLVSKWIGETEKNLAAVFDAAEQGGAALLFDEADALFGRRTEVGDARDRYANLETAYLLARLERFDGIAVLATNLRQNLDPAFARRIEFVVPFDPPDETARLALWRAHLPPGAPLAPDVDLPTLAAVYELPGALIRNAAVAAAFLAAAAPDEDRRIGTAELAHAVRREHAKAGLAYPGPPPGARTARPDREEAPR